MPTAWTIVSDIRLVTGRRKMILASGPQVVPNATPLEMAPFQNPLNGPANIINPSKVRVVVRYDQPDAASFFIGQLKEYMPNGISPGAWPWWQVIDGISVNRGVQATLGHAFGENSADSYTLNNVTSGPTAYSVLLPASDSRLVLVQGGPTNMPIQTIYAFVEEN